MRLDEGVSYLDMLVMYADDIAVLGKLLYLWSRLEADGQDQWCMQLHTALCHSNRHWKKWGSTVRPPQISLCSGAEG